jgi:Tol biopolymer transport system component
MKADRYARVEELFDAALDVPPDERASFLDRACGSDPLLRREVESLLDAYQKAEAFIETRAIDVAAKSLAGDSGLSLTGKTIGRYQIVSMLGAGGMGEVYLAHDSQMDRRVALKLLPRQFTQSADRVVRFHRESRAASAINHPNIITTYEIGHDGGVHFIASEYVEGETLRAKINRGPLKLEIAIDISIQVASALAAAHAEGIIHRDIKPENVMIRQDGYVKVLDFGLAKLVERDRIDGLAENSTQSGLVLGTINYMSPEQARAQEIDNRTDIFSLGIVMYEMIAGQQPFKGATPASTFDAILNRAPAAISNPEASAELKRIINRALEKDMELRYQTASDLRAVLKRLQRSMNSDAASAGPVAASQDSGGRTAGSWWKRVALGSIAVGVLATGLSYLAARPGSAPERIAWQNAKVFKLTDQRGEELFPCLSPDGKTLLYTSAAAGHSDIYSKRIGSRKAANLTQGSGADNFQPAFSPDGQRIAFRRTGRDGSGIYLMTETGENVKRLTVFGYNPAWSHDGKEIVCTENNVFTSIRTLSTSRMWIVNALTGNHRVVETGDAVQPNWSPHGQRIAYWGMIHQGVQRDIWTVAVDGGEPVPVTNDSHVDWNPVWSADGRHLYFVSNRMGLMGLWRVAIDETSGRVSSEPELVPTPSANTQLISFSRDGRSLAYVQSNTTENISKLTFEPVAGKVVGNPIEVTESSGRLTSPSVSPDGKMIACQSAGDQLDIFTLTIGNPVPNQLTDDETNEMVPAWSWDGKKIAYYSNRNGTYQVYVVNSDGSGARQITESAAAGGAVLPVWSPDGFRLSYSLLGDRSFIIDLRRPFREQIADETPDPPGMTHFVARSWSPNGRYLAGRGYDRSVYRGVLIYDIEARTYDLISDFGSWPVWLEDSRRLLFINDERIYLADVRTKKPKEIYSLLPRRLTGLDVSRDNRSIYISVASPEADIWLLRLE